VQLQQHGPDPQGRGTRLVLVNTHGHSPSNTYLKWCVSPAPVKYNKFMLKHCTCLLRLITYWLVHQMPFSVPDSNDFYHFCKVYPLFAQSAYRRGPICHHIALKELNRLMGQLPKRNQYSAPGECSTYWNVYLIFIGCLKWNF
jgi:hypothetical protein